ncbi:ATP-binding cassette domain-containing protein [Caulobacter sp. NIBR1757]|uniref:peptidase domain-containing ABC transporter n=1 Tax=Caulobacter sp. NIBR1757 TaxID=3016000 RepID=UPI0022F03ECC|nr:ATP-binding cassette domain-containing protein [Caulobacter sp. NIBR1757]WGM37724.1 Vitamin B12 import ATP-binding protein BtuD [Caulobacter sp. NIBR1757]
MFYESAAVRLPRNLELQIQPGDCGLVCAAAMLALFGARIGVQDIRRHVGGSSRGLTIRQVRDTVRACGGAAEAVAFDPTIIEQMPIPSILLLQRGHYVVVARRAGRTLTIFYPEFGWARVAFESLTGQLSKFAVTLGGVDSTLLPTPSKRQVPLVILAALRAFEPKGLSLLVLLTVLTQLLLLSLPTVTAKLIDNQSPSGEFKEFGGATLLYVLVSAMTGVVVAAGIYVAQRVARSAGLNMGDMLFTRLGRKENRWFESLPTDGVRNVVGSADGVVRLINNSSATLTIALTSLIVSLAALAHLSPWILAICLPLIAITGSIDFFAERGLLGASVRLFEAGQRKGRFIGDALAQLPLFRRANKLSGLKAKYVETLRASVDAEAGIAVRRAAIGTGSNLIKAVDLLSFSFLASILMKNGLITVGGFVAAGAYKVALTQSVTSLIGLYGQAISFGPNIRQADDLFMPYGPDERLVQDEITSLPGIVFEAVDFRYSPFSELVLRDLNLAVQPADFVVIAGASGCGKTTIARLICGLDSPTAGRVMVGGRAADGQADVSAVLQTDKLFDASIRENVALFDDRMTDEDITHALETVCLLDFVKQLPMGLSTNVSEARGGLSAGQRQRLLLARAVASKAKILILDEATSNVDVETEAVILTRLRTTGATIVLIAHRPDAWKSADRIYDLVTGSLVLRENSSDTVSYSQAVENLVQRHARQH